MKRLFAGLLAILLVSVMLAAPAEAGWNKRNNPDGTTGWVNPDGDEILVNERYINVLVENISSASTPYVVSPIAGTIVAIYSVAFGATTVDDAVLTARIGGTAITGGTITIEGTGSAGDVDSATPTANNTVTAGQAISIETDGGSTGDVDAQITFVIRR